MTPAEEVLRQDTRLAQRFLLPRAGFEWRHASELERMRIVAAIAKVAAEDGEESATVARVAGLARVSTQAFYEHFDDCSDCLLAMFDEVVTLVAERAGAADRSQAGWVERMRAGMLALLEFLDEEPELARVCVDRAMTSGVATLARRMELPSELERLPDEGRANPPMSQPLPAHTADGVIGGTLGIIHACLHRSEQRPPAHLINPLMAMIVLPYLGEAAALRELTRA
jgi:AcrR family transcriptional regulator